MSSNDTLAAIPHFYGFAPTIETGPRAVPVNIPILTGVQETLEFDMFTENANGIMPWISSMWVDNLQGTEPLILIMGSTGQRVGIPAFSQGTIPVFTGDQVRFSITPKVEPSSDWVLRLLLLNIPMGLSFTPVM